MTSTLTELTLDPHDERPPSGETKGVVGRRDQLEVTLARQGDNQGRDVEEALRLRYHVFAQELGATLKSASAERDHDRYDDFCTHVIVRDRATAQVVATTRILGHEEAAEAGGFYSESEFDLTAVLAQPGRFMEVGRTCVAPSYRSGAAMQLLWAGLSQYWGSSGFDYMIGCASIPMEDGGTMARAVMRRLRERHFSPENMRVIPRHQLPEPAAGEPERERVEEQPVVLPPLLKAYLRLNALICGDACFDPEFNVADVFILVQIAHINERYYRHFLRQYDQTHVATRRG